MPISCFFQSFSKMQFCFFFLFSFFLSFLLFFKFLSFLRFPFFCLFCLFFCSFVSCHSVAKCTLGHLRSSKLWEVVFNAKCWDAIGWIDGMGWMVIYFKSSLIFYVATNGMPWLCKNIKFSFKTPGI